MEWSRVSSLVLTTNDALETFTFWYGMCELMENCAQSQINDKFEGFKTYWGYFEGSQKHWGWLSELFWNRFESSDSLFGALSTGIVRFAGRRHDFWWFLIDFGTVFGSQNRWKNESELLEKLGRFPALIFNTILNSFGVEHKVSNTSFHVSDENCGSRLWTLWDV